MSGKTKFWTGIVTGACIGGIVALLNRDARDYGKSLLTQTSDCVSDCLHHPEDVVQKVKHSLTTFNDFIKDNTDQALNALEQIEQTVNRFKK